MKIFESKSLQSQHWVNKDISFVEFCNALREPVVSQYTYQQFKAMKKQDQTTVKGSGGAYVLGGAEQDGPRRKEAIRTRSGLVYDFDKVPEGLENLKKFLREKCGYNYALYTTFSSSADTPRCRVVIPFDGAYNAGIYEPVMRGFAEEMGWLDALAKDSSTYQPERAMFKPVVPADRKDEYECVFDTDNHVLNPAEFLNRYYLEQGKNPMNPADWPRSDKEPAMSAYRKIQAAEQPKKKGRGRPSKKPLAKPKMPTEAPVEPLGEGEGRNNAIIRYMGLRVRYLNPDAADLEEQVWEEIQKANELLCKQGETLEDDELRLIQKSVMKFDDFGAALNGWTVDRSYQKSEAYQSLNAEEKAAVDAKKEQETTADGVFKARTVRKYQPFAKNPEDEGPSHIKAPLDVFNPEMRNYIIEAAEAVAVEPEMVMAYAISVVCACLLRRYRVWIRNCWEEAVTLYMFVCAPSGERKSAAFSLVHKAYETAIEAYNKSRKKEIAQYRVERKRTQIEYDREMKKQNSENGESYNEARAVQLELKLQELKEHPVEAYMYKLEDATPEGLRNQCRSNGNRVYFASAEPSFFTGIKQYTNSKSDSLNLTPYLHGYDEEDWTVTRAGAKKDRNADENGTYEIRKLVVCICMGIQTYVLDAQFDKARNGDMTGSGFMQRGLYAFVGSAKAGEPPMDQNAELLTPSTQDWFNTLISDLLRDADFSINAPEKTLKFSAAAYQDMRKWEKECDRVRKDTQEDKFMREWFAKCAGKTARLAAVLLACQGRAKLDEGVIDAQTFQNAVRLMKEYFIPQLQEYFADDELVRNGRAIWDRRDNWIRDQMDRDGTDIIYVGDITRAVRNTISTSQVYEALELLEARGMIQVDGESSQLTGRPLFIRFVESDTTE